MLSKPPAGQLFEAILNTAHLFTTVSLEVDELLVQHTPIYVCQETLVAYRHLRTAGEKLKPLHSPYTVWADFTDKGGQFREPWVVLTDQILPIVLGMDFLARTGSRLLINGNPEQRRAATQRMKQQRKRLRWREDDEGLGDSSTEEQVTPTKYRIITRPLCRTTRVVPLSSRDRNLPLQNTPKARRVANTPASIVDKAWERAKFERS